MSLAVILSRRQKSKSVLTLDAVFLAGYLGSAYCESFNNTMNGYLHSAIDPMTRQTIRIVVVKDLFKVENQIPLSDSQCAAQAKRVEFSLPTD